LLEITACWSPANWTPMPPTFRGAPGDFRRGRPLTASKVFVVRAFRTNPNQHRHMQQLAHSHFSIRSSGHGFDSLHQVTLQSFIRPISCVLVPASLFDFTQHNATCLHLIFCLFLHGTLAVSPRIHYKPVQAGHSLIPGPVYLSLELLDAHEPAWTDGHDKDDAAEEG
jgi:hypothetical protein